MASENFIQIAPLGRLNSLVGPAFQIGSLILAEDILLGSFVDDRAEFLEDLACFLFIALPRSGQSPLLKGFDATLDSTTSLGALSDLTHSLFCRLVIGHKTNPFGRGGTIVIWD